jgi:sulfur-oxidizing protein SoxX
MDRRGRRSRRARRLRHEATEAETQAKAAQVLKASFKARGQAGMDRLDQDDTQKLCTEYATAAPPKDVAEKIEKINIATIAWPADGKYLGDWRNGERIAQEGRGKQWSDDPAGPVGGNCYACHQLAPQEVSYGTIGPPLYQFGKVRGYNDEIRKYAYGRSTTPRPTTRAPTCRASGTARYLPKRRSRISSRC